GDLSNGVECVLVQPTVRDVTVDPASNATPFRIRRVPNDPSLLPRDVFGHLEQRAEFVIFESERKPLGLVGLDRQITRLAMFIANVSIELDTVLKVSRALN